MEFLNLNLPLRTRLKNHRAGEGWRNKCYGLEYGQCFDQPAIWFTDLKKLESVWRLKGYADEIAKRISHKGWYTDSFHDGLCRGIIAQLPARKGECVYMAGFACTDSDTIFIDPSGTWSDEIGAANEADRMAERYAEDERKGEAKDSAENQIAELRTDNASCLEDIHSLRAELLRVRQCGHALADLTIRERIADLVATIRKNRKRISGLEDNYWLAVPA